MPRVILDEESRYKMAHQKPERHTKRTFLKWATDREWLDRNRPLPPLSIGTDLALRAIDPKLFLAFNNMLWRWELWRDHATLEGSKGLAWSISEPYFVHRISLHPNYYDEMGHCIKACPMRPPRFAKGWPLNDPRRSKKLYIVYHKECPKHCPGIWDTPDERIVRVVRQMQLNIDGRLEDIENRFMWEQFLDQQRKDNYLTRHTEAIVSDRLNRLLGIQQFGYTGKAAS